MTKGRLNGLYLLFLGSVVFVLVGATLSYMSPDAMVDFKASYYSARCLVQQRDPYKQSEVLQEYHADREAPFTTATASDLMMRRHVYPPTAVFFAVPFALLPWGPARVLWFTLTAGSLIFASFLAWDLGADYAPTLSGALAGFLLANSEVLILLGNPSGIAISLCVAAVWCFLRERFIPAGILCLAFSLAIKPQDAAFFWLFFFLAGGVYRKYALRTLLATVALSLPVLLWVWHVAPHWMQELHSNMLELFVPGSVDYPGPAASGINGLVNLQEVVSAFWNDPRIYNALSYLVGALLLFGWAFVTLRSCHSPKRAWLALATIATLSLLPVYHHLYDTKLLVLTVPACAMLWAEGGLIGWLALLVNAVCFVLIGDFSGVIVLSGIRRLHVSANGLGGLIVTTLQTFPVPLILLVIGVFYLWIYVRAGESTLGNRHSPEDLCVHKVQK
jgi:alpha-1,2-mannosyltransferase